MSKGKIIIERTEDRFCATLLTSADEWIMGATGADEAEARAKLAEHLRESGARLICRATNGIAAVREAMAALEIPVEVAA